ncbi:MAG: VapC toxin family PIN domain ribonuclease [Acidobacteria bacterium]|nr:MAG: VapC toxin family PIN domain ribonuclease [Acidobacteriota bacterium]
MASLVVVDTDILIDASRAVGEALACLDQLEDRSALAVSAVTEMELVVGCRDKVELRALGKFLNRFQVIGLNERISDAAVELLRRYRLSHGLLIADAVIAATALVLDTPLISKNQRDYRFIAGLNLLSYPNPFPSS